MHIGSHVSTRGGYAAAARAALQLDAGAFQYFPMNPRGLHTKQARASDCRSCAEICAAAGLLSIGHAPYPLNPAAEAEQRELMLEVLLNGLEITEACGSIGLVVHFGKYSGKDPLQGYKNIIQLLNSAGRQFHGKSLILLENQAGEGSQLGLTMEELVQVRKLCDEPDKIGFCLDTCHAFASGMWSGSDWAAFVGRGEELGFFEHLQAIHLNDSAYPAGSRRDRHARIGQGCIGTDWLRLLLAAPFARRIPIVLETEAGSDGTHRSEIAYVKELAGLRA